MFVHQHKEKFKIKLKNFQLGFVLVCDGLLAHLFLLLSISFPFSQPTAFAIICSLWPPSRPVPPLFLTSFWFPRHYSHIYHYMSAGPGDSTVPPGKGQSAASRCVLQRVTLTWNERGLVRKTPLMLLGCFPSRDWPILRVRSVSFIWLSTAGLYLGL